MTRRRVQRLPAADLLSRGAEFFDDHSFGIPGEGLQFNEEGLRALCSVLGVPLTVVESVERHELATELLNDLLARHDVQEELAQRNFVWDKDRGIILGVVSTTYRSYSNHRLLNDMYGFLSGNGNGKVELHFQAAFSVNTKLRLRILKEIEHGEVSGSGGTGSDRSVVGLQVANSMTGDTAVGIKFYVERLLCANGMIAPVSHTENRVFHSGGEASFAGRLASKVGSVLSGADGTLKMLNELSDLAFDARSLAKTGYTKEILDVIPEFRTPLKKAGTGLKFGKDVPNNERKLQRPGRTVSEVVADWGLLGQRPLLRHRQRHDRRSASVSGEQGCTHLRRPLGTRQRQRVHHAAGPGADPVQLHVPGRDRRPGREG